MTETLRRVVAFVERLPPEQQDQIAEIIQIELDERAWNELFATAASQRFVEQAAAEALQEDASARLGTQLLSGEILHH